MSMIENARFPVFEVNHPKYGSYKIESVSMNQTEAVTSTNPFKKTEIPYPITEALLGTAMTVATILLIIRTLKNPKK